MTANRLNRNPLKPTAKGIRHWGLLVFMLLLMGSCARKEDNTGILEGKVFFISTTIPVTGMVIETAGLQSETNEEGAYRIEGIPIGDQLVSATKEGFTPFSKSLTIVQGTNTLSISMFSQSFTSHITGTVRGNFSGDPKPGIAIVMLNPDESESDIAGTTSGEGTYDLTMVPFGDRLIVGKLSGQLLFQEVVLVDQPQITFDIDLPESTTVTDERDGKTYTAGKIGDQIWMLENMAYMPFVAPPDWESDSLELYYVYDYQGTDTAEARQSDNYRTYGVLYNWPAAKTCCPTGWHLATDEEWRTLEEHLGMDPSEVGSLKWRNSGEVGLKMKSDTGWDSDGIGDNSSTLAILPGGSRGGGSFNGIGIRANLWTSSMNQVNTIWYRYLSYNNNGVYRYGQKGILGFSVRCVKDKT